LVIGADFSSSGVEHVDGCAVIEKIWKVRNVEEKEREIIHARSSGSHSIPGIAHQKALGSQTTGHSTVHIWGFNKGNIISCRLPCVAKSLQSLGVDIFQTHPENFEFSPNAFIDLSSRVPNVVARQQPIKDGDGNH
jgi:hypothetical protein